LDREEVSTRDEEAAYLPLKQRRERHFDFAFGAGVDDTQFQPKHACGPLRLLDVIFGIRNRWIHQEANNHGLGSHFVEQFQPLRRSRLLEEAQAGQIAAGLVKIIGEAKFVRIGTPMNTIGIVEVAALAASPASVLDATMAMTCLLTSSAASR
jgi:hypothetical protein